MNIGISTACFYPMPTELTIPIIGSLGLKKIEVFMEAYSEYKEDFCKRLKQEIIRHDLEVVSVHAFCSAYEPFMFTDYPRRKRDSFEIFRMALNAGRLLGAKYFTFHGNRKDATTEAFDYRAFGRDMDIISEIAGEYGILLAWENVCWCQSGSPAFIKKAMEYITSDHLQFTLDIKQAYRAGVDPVEYIKVMGNKIVNVHMNDADQQNSCLLPGNGNIDLKNIIRSLNELGYNGDFVIEVYRKNFQNNSDIVNSADYLKNLINFSSTN